MGTVGRAPGAAPVPAPVLLEDLLPAGGVLDEDLVDILGFLPAGSSSPFSLLLFLPLPGIFNY